MKKILHPLIAFSLGACCLLGAASNQDASKSRSKFYSDHADTSTAQQKYDIMRRDQIDTTDALAIPFDDSEIEDEEQIDWDEDKDVFPLPHSP